LAHAAALLITAGTSAPKESGGGPPPEPASSTAIEIEVGSVSSPLATTEGNAESLEPPGAARPNRSGSARAPLEPRGSDPGAVGLEPAPSAGPNAGDYALDPAANTPGPAAHVDLGIAPGDWSRWTDPSAPAPETAAPRPSPAPVSTTGGVAEALEAHDHEIGLGPAGGVLSAARDAAHSDVAPQLGTATFAITVLRTGIVDVQLTSASANVDGWQKVAATMAANIRKRPPEIHPPRNGVRIGIELVAEEHWPNGAPARTEAPSVAVTPPAIRAVDQAKEDLARRNPAAIPPPGSPVEQPSLVANVDLPGVFLQGRGKVCSYKIGVTPFGLGASGGCDPSNIGAKPQRVVSTRVLGESMF
jgi:hypothetical protein